MQRGGGSAGWVLAVAVLAMAAVGLLDYLTPAEVDFGEFYMVPVILVAWAVGRRTGLLLAVAATVIELLVDTNLRGASSATVEAVALWNGLATLLVLAAIAVITDIVYRERARYRALDAERATLLRALEVELPRPLRAADWFARTFEEALHATLTPAVTAQFAALRRHTAEAMFLATDLLALGKLRLGGLRFELAPVALGAIVGEAIEASPEHSRILLRSTEERLVVLADADRLRHAISSVIARFLDLSSRELVSVLLRASGDEAVVAISARTAEIAPADLEFAELLVKGNNGRIVRVPGDSRRDSLVSLYVPRAAPLGSSPVSDPRSTERAPRT
jgi:signal transduction histidine kinase